MDYGGHDSKFTNNFVYAYGKHCFGTGSFRKGHADIFADNTCIVVDRTETTSEDVDDRHEMTTDPAGSNVGTLYQCSAKDGMNPANNRYYTANGEATWKCPANSDPLTLSDMQQMGFEINSTVNVIPDDVTIIMNWAKQVLGLN